MTHRMFGGAKRINVILSEAKNLLHIRGIAGMARSFAEFILSEVEGLRMTTVGRSVRKSTLSCAGMTIEMVSELSQRHRLPAVCGLVI